MTGNPSDVGNLVSLVIGQMMFWAGLSGLVLYVGWRWGSWLFGQSHTDGIGAHVGRDNLGASAGRDNSGTQQVFHGPVTATMGASVPIPGKYPWAKPEGASRTERG